MARLLPWYRRPGRRLCADRTRRRRACLWSSGPNLRHRRLDERCLGLRVTDAVVAELGRQLALQLAVLLDQVRPRAQRVAEGDVPLPEAAVVLDEVDVVAARLAPTEVDPVRDVCLTHALVAEAHDGRDAAHTIAQRPRADHDVDDRLGRAARHGGAPYVLDDNDAVHQLAQRRNDARLLALERL